MDEAPATRDATAMAVSGAAPEPEDQLRADTYRVLGSLLAAAPDSDTLELFAGAPVAEDGDLLAVAWRLLATSAGRTTAQQVEDEFAALFIGIGRGELMPYSSWYLTGFLMEQPLAKLRSDLKRLGFDDGRVDAGSTGPGWPCRYFRRVHHTFTGGHHRPTDGHSH